MPVYTFGFRNQNQNLLYKYLINRNSLTMTKQIQVLLDTRSFSIQNIMPSSSYEKKSRTSSSSTTTYPYIHFISIYSVAVSVSRYYYATLCHIIIRIVRIDGFYEKGQGPVGCSTLKPKQWGSISDCYGIT